MNNDSIFTTWQTIIRETADQPGERVRRLDEAVERLGGLVDTGEVIDSDGVLHVLDPEVYSCAIDGETFCRLPAVWINRDSLSPMPPVSL